MLSRAPHPLPCVGPCGACAALLCVHRLYIAGCIALRALPAGLGALPVLNTIDASRCAKLTLIPEAIGRLHRLQILRIDGCVSLQTLPSRLPPLHSLSAAGCISLRALPHDVAGWQPQVRSSHPERISVLSANNKAICNRTY